MKVCRTQNYNNKTLKLKINIYNEIKLKDQQNKISTRDKNNVKTKD